MTPPTTITTRRNYIQSAVGQVRRTLLGDFDDVADDDVQQVFVTPSIKICPKVRAAAEEEEEEEEVEKIVKLENNPSVGQVRRTLLDDLDDADVQQDTHVLSIKISPKVRAATEEEVERIEKIARERIRKLRNNPPAEKKTEWDRKMRVLMSMR